MIFFCYELFTTAARRQHQQLSLSLIPLSLSIFFLQFFFIFFVRIIKGKKGEEKFKKEAKSLIKKYFGYLCVSKEEEEEEGLNELS